MNCICNGINKCMFHQRIEMQERIDAGVPRPDDTRGVAYIDEHERRAKEERAALDREQAAVKAHREAKA